MAAEGRERARADRLRARRDLLLAKRRELAAVSGVELAAMSVLDARRLGRQYFRLGELVARLERRLA